MKFWNPYKKAKRTAKEVLIYCQIKELPVDVIKIARALQIKIFADVSGDFLPFGQRGKSYSNSNGVYIIFNTYYPISEIRFTIAHELGHILLGHLTNPKQMKRVEFERQADMFALRILAPSCVLWGLNLHDYKEIAKTCQISRQAAIFRAERMAVLYKRNRFLRTKLERQVFDQFQTFININKK